MPIVTASYSLKTDLTVCSLLYDVDLVPSITWIVKADPLIRWSTSIVYLLDSISSFERIMGKWLNKKVKGGTVKVFSMNEKWESVRKPSSAASL